MNKLFDYLNYRCFLKDYFKEQKVKNPYYSYKYIANKAGLKSKSFIHEVVAGKKNLSKTSLFALGKALDLNAKAFAYFENLVAFNQAENDEQKNHFFKKLMEHNKRTVSRLISKDQYDYFSGWHHSTIRELIGMFDVKDDYALLGQLLRPSISSREARESVELLERLGLIHKTGNRFRITHKSITTGDEVTSIAIKNFHAQNLNIAVSALYNCPADERDISAIVGGLSLEGFTAIKCEIQLFRKKLMEIMDRDKNKRKVYVINFQIFPTSEEAQR
jgi:uncharacterized protein (TIGR02147 family)